MRIAVVSHDAGSSELLCALIAAHLDKAEWHIFAIPNSPMSTICNRSNLTFTPISDANQQLANLDPELLLFGTGWQEKCERPYVSYCKTHSIPTVAFLDHWTNYRERFGYPEAGWENNRGDFTAVSDQKAFELAISQSFPNPLPLPNLYLKKLAEEASKRSIFPSQKLLFLSEPTDTVAIKSYDDPMHWGFTQYTVLQDILEQFSHFQCQELTIRLHPSEKSKEYDSILSSYPHIISQINRADEMDLIDQILEAKVIIGFDSMALYIAAMLGKPLISYLPSNNREFLVPLPKERQLRSLNGLSPEHLQPIHLEISNFGMDFASFIQNVIKKNV